MLTQEQVLEAVRKGEKSGNWLDGRDFARLCNFFPVSDWKTLGFEAKEGFDTKAFTPTPWTREEILKQLEKDTSFAFEKALDQRGISAGLMRECVKLWLWVLEEHFEEEDDENYPQYGLPLLKRVAIEYGFENPIGDKRGDERESSKHEPSCPILPRSLVA